MIREIGKKEIKFHKRENNKSTACCCKYVSMYYKSHLDILDIILIIQFYFIYSCC